MKEFKQLNTYLYKILEQYRTMICIESHDDSQKQLRGIEYLFDILENTPNSKYVNIMVQGDMVPTPYPNPMSYVNYKDINEAICKFISLDLTYVQI